MEQNVLHCAFHMRIRTRTIAYSHAMPCGLVTPTSITCIGNDVLKLTLEDIFMGKGISVPISRGGPPLAIE